jgi:hypothetical protein
MFIVLQQIRNNKSAKQQIAPFSLSTGKGGHL